MRLLFTNWARVASILLMMLASQVALSSISSGAEHDVNYWLKRRNEFYENTSFPLSQDNQRLLGGKFVPAAKGHLPFWFDFELFKVVYNKHYSSNQDELTRHHLYVKSCVRALKARVLYRILAGTRDTLIGSDADRVSIWLALVGWIESISNCIESNNMY